MNTNLVHIDIDRRPRLGAMSCDRGSVYIVSTFELRIYTFTSVYCRCCYHGTWYITNQHKHALRGTRIFSIIDTLHVVRTYLYKYVQLVSFSNCSNISGSSGSSRSNSWYFSPRPGCHVPVRMSLEACSKFKGSNGAF